MSIPYHDHIDMQKNEVQNMILQRLASAPASPVAGQKYYDTTLNQEGYYNGSAWIYMSNGSGNVTQASNSGSAGRVKVSGGADRTIADYSGGAGLLKADANGVLSPAVAGTDYMTGASTNSMTNKTFDANGIGNTLSNVEVADFAGSAIITSTTLTGASNSNLATALAVKTYIDNLLAGNDAMVYKGGIDASTNPNYPAGDAGHTYKITVAGLIGGASGVAVQVGDTIICTLDGSASGNQATVGANWTILQNNVDQATTSSLGLVALATQAEAEAKSNSTKAVVPSDLVNFPIKKIFTIGDGTATSIACTHNLGTSDVVVQVRRTTDNAVIQCGIVVTSTNVVTLSFSTAPATNTIKVVVIG